MKRLDDRGVPARRRAFTVALAVSLFGATLVATYWAVQFPDPQYPPVFVHAEVNLRRKVAIDRDDVRFTGDCRFGTIVLSGYTLDSVGLLPSPSVDVPRAEIICRFSVERRFASLLRLLGADPEREVEFRSSGHWVDEGGTRWWELVQVPRTDEPRYR